MTIHTAGNRRWLFYTMLIAALSSIVMGVISIEYANYATRKNRQQWCEVVSTLDDGYKANPPQSPTGKHLANEFARLRLEFQCKGVNK